MAKSSRRQMLYFSCKLSQGTALLARIWVSDCIWKLQWILCISFFRTRRQHPTKQQLYGYLPPITKTIKVIRSRHAGHCRRSKDDLIRDVFLWTPLHGCAKAGLSARTYIQQHCADTGCSPEDLQEAIDDSEGQGYTCWWRDVMMRMTMTYTIYYFNLLHNQSWSPFRSRCYLILYLIWFANFFTPTLADTFSLESAWQ